MVNLGLVSDKNKLSTASLSFRLPYFTNWGERILVCGSEPVVGSWNVKQDVLLSPSHEEDELIWSGAVTVSTGFKCEYSYYLVDDNKNVLRWGSWEEKHRVVVPEGIRDRDWQNSAKLTVPGGASMASCTAKAVEWNSSCSNNLDPSDRTALGAHDSAYKAQVPVATMANAKIPSQIVNNDPRMVSAPTVASSFNHLRQHAFIKLSAPEPASDSMM
ncbi:hypothetical protein GIB67_004206 [Kingdonia uniflora]|uniref:CBM20 domain-containing protein n=1 Tax=Kingdonia uniflora TaxID=39325 RepID=A0A7J7P1B3_9MAGN|nr:hypothetical protein GIB67_004206 [Kingdonia uniflora]